MAILTAFFAFFLLSVVAEPAWFFSFGAWLRKVLSKIKKASALRPRSIGRGWLVLPSDDAVRFRDWVSRDDFKNPGDPRMKPALGSHLLVELYGCARETLEQEDTVREAMEEAARQSNATVVTSSFHEFKPFGVSGAVIIQESHYTIHTWPEHRYAAVDLFYCSEAVKVEQALEALRKHFQPKRVRFLLVRRGLQNEVEK